MTFSSSYVLKKINYLKKKKLKVCCTPILHYTPYRVLSLGLVILRFHELWKSSWKCVTFLQLFNSSNKSFFFIKIIKEIYKKKKKEKKLIKKTKVFLEKKNKKETVQSRKIKTVNGKQILVQYRKKHYTTRRKCFI